MYLCEKAWIRTFYVNNFVLTVSHNRQVIWIWIHEAKIAKKFVLKCAENLTKNKKNSHPWCPCSRPPGWRPRYFWSAWSSFCLRVRKVRGEAQAAAAAVTGIPCPTGSFNISERCQGLFIEIFMEITEEACLSAACLFCLQ